MKIRRKADSWSPERQVERVIRRIIRSDETAPIDDMAELIERARESEAARDATLALILHAFDVEEEDDEEPVGLATCWLALVAGELDGDGLRVVASGFGPDDLRDDAIQSVLTRRATEAMDLIMEMLESEIAASLVTYRIGLYECLYAVVLRGDAAQKQRLRRIARDQVSAERAFPREESAVFEALALLAAVGDSEVAALAQSIGDTEHGEEWGEEGTDPLERIRALAADTLDYAGRTLEGDWRKTAQRIEEDFAADDDDELLGDL